MAQKGRKCYSNSYSFFWGIKKPILICIRMGKIAMKKKNSLFT
jgi:hypothetical protein